MADNNPSNYLKWITPTPGDPTYSILKAHLLFEELLNAYLARTLPHASALQGARLTFTQTLALARASSTHLLPEHWIWTAISSLNKIRNSLSHEARPKDLPEKSKAYVDFVLANTKIPLPEPAVLLQGANSAQPSSYSYTAMDMVTISLYYGAAVHLGFKSQELTTP